MADKRSELTNSEIKNILRQAALMGTPKVDLFGGEPLMRKDVMDLIRSGAEKGLYMSITTNGWLLTKEFVYRLKKAGISCINISLDSVSMDTHDRLRGLPGLYNRATDGVRHCYEAGIPCIISTYATRSRIKNFGCQEADDSQLGQIIALARKLRASGIRILFPIISGRWAHNKTKELTEEEKKRVIDGIDHSFAFIEGAYSVKRKRKVCQSLIGKMFNISPYGDIQLCIAFPDSFGNVREKPLSELLRSMYNHTLYRKNKNGSCCNADKLIR